MSDNLKLRVSDVIQQTLNAISLRLVPEPEQPISYKAGQFLTFIFKSGERELRRSYSLSSSPVADNYLEITLKRVVNGEVSTYLFNNIKQGDTLEALPPAGRFTLETNSFAQRDIFLIAAGSGIAPIYSLLKTILIEEPLSRITLIYSNTSERTTIFYEQLNELAKRYPTTFNLIYIFSDPADKNYKYKAHLNLGLLQQLITENLVFQKSDAEFFLCGPFAFMRMADTMIVVMGFDESRIHKENFVIRAEPEAINTPPAMEDQSDKLVNINYKGINYALNVPYNKTILKAALEQGINLPYSCNAGICGTCAALCKEGQVKLAINEVLTPKDLSEGWALTCVGYALTKQVKLQF